ncbi:MAG: Hpt domain-containing protein [Bacteriovorax sp.]|nr:Hpt domain-containing protein [Bacteriovorax sp.]
MKKQFDLTSEIPLPGLESFYDEFLATRIDELGETKRALIAKNYQIVAEYAHKWKGFSAPYGFGVLGQIALEIEKCLEVDEIKRCEILLNEAETYLTVTKKKGDF